MKVKFVHLLILICIIFVGFACKKSPGKGSLYLSLKDVNGVQFNPGDKVIFSFEFSHPDNEVANDTLLITRKFFTCPYSNKIVNDTVELPEYTSTKDQLGSVELSFDYGKFSTGYTSSCSNNGLSPKVDSAIFIFKLKDKNGIISDSVISPKILLKI